MKLLAEIMPVNLEQQALKSGQSLVMKVSARSKNTFGESRQNRTTEKYLYASHYL